MITCKCIKKFRSNGKIVGYRLIDLNEQTQDVESDILKRAIKNKDIHVINLKLTADDRLIDCTEAQLKSKKLESNKTTNKDIKTTSIGKALAYIDICLLNMGDSLNDIVDALSIGADIDVDGEYNDVESAAPVMAMLYSKIAAKNPNYIRIYWDDMLEEDYVAEQIKDAACAECANSLKECKTYIALKEICKYLNEVDKKLVKKIKENIIRDIEKDAIASMKIGYEVGHEYFNYLDRSIFGTITNSCFTVGHVITADEKKRFKELAPYSYMCSKDFNTLSPRPEVSINFLFKNKDKDNVEVDIKLSRIGYVSKGCVNRVAFIKDVGSITLNVENKNNAKIVAQMCNEVGAWTRRFANVNPSLLRILPLGEAPEQFK